MPVAPTYPGVYIQEIPSGVRTITPVSTSVTAFIGRALKGPLNEPIMVNSFGDFDRVFGGLWSDSPMSYAVRDFFLNGGSQALIVRLYAPTFLTDAERTTAFNSARTRALNAATAVRDGANAEVANGAAAIKAAASTATDAQLSANLGDIAVSTAAGMILGVIRDTADSPRPKTEIGPITNAATDAITDLADAIKLAITALKVAMTGKATVQDALNDGQANIDAVADAAVKAVLQADYDRVEAANPANPGEMDTLIADEELAERTKQDLIIAATLAVETAVTNEIAAASSTLSSIGNAANAARDAQVVVNPVVAPYVTSLAASVNTAIGDPPNGSTIVAAGSAALNSAADAGANAAAPRAKATLTINGLDLQAKYEGSWGNNLRARITTNTESRRLGTDLKSFNLFVRDDATGVIETFIEVTSDITKPRYVNEVIKGESKLVTVENAPTVVTASNPVAQDGVAADRDAWTDAFSTRVSPSNFGSDGNELEDSAFNDPNLESGKQGLWALEKVELFNLLCIPPRAKGKDIGAGVIDSAIAYCKFRRAFMIVDCPQTWGDKDEAKSEMAILPFEKSDYAAIYFPRLRAKDPLQGNRKVDVAPCGAVAGIMARTDTNRGIWKAPAGLDATIVGYPELSVNLTDAENGELNPIGLNCLRSNAAGRIVWGARTLRGDDRFASEYKYVPVRRLALHIENSLYRGLQWVVFEPNDEPLWAQIRLNLGAFMQGLFRQGAFEGASPKDAYFVKCDAETTTATDRNLGIVNIIVGFAPLKPAEFVILSLQQMARKES